MTVASRDSTTRDATPPGCSTWAAHDQGERLSISTRGELKRSVCRFGRHGGRRPPRRLSRIADAEKSGVVVDARSGDQEGAQVAVVAEVATCASDIELQRRKVDAVRRRLDDQRGRVCRKNPQPRGDDSAGRLIRHGAAERQFQSVRVFLNSPGVSCRKLSRPPRSVATATNRRSVRPRWLRGRSARDRRHSTAPPHRHRSAR